MAQTDNLWSVLRYDLKTALEVAGLPCCLKLANDMLGDTPVELLERSGIGTGSMIKLEKELRLPCVRVRIREAVDPDWFVFTKGEEFVEEHSRFVGREIYLPLGYRGRLRLCDRQGGTKYHNIREVVADFPRFIRVEQDTVCATPGCRSYQVVHAGAELELDRVTEGNRLLRGMRETYLVCTDRSDFRELTFPVFSPGHFSKLGDNTKYTLAELVERLPLPQTVEFLGVNPYDVITADDDQARELLVMLSGPVEILEVTMTTMYVGLVQTKLSDRCDIIAIPSDCDDVNHSMVYIPISYVVDGVDNPYCKINLGRLNADVMRECLYLQPVESQELLLLKNMPTRDRDSYNLQDVPDTPRLPRKSDGCMTLKSTLSAPTGNDTGDMEPEVNIRRRRFLSTGDLKQRKSVSIHSPERESRGIKSYLSQLTRRMKSSASQLLLGFDMHNPTPRLTESRDRARDSASSRKHRPSSVKSGGFVCYLHEEFGDLRSTSEPSRKEEVNKNQSTENTHTNGADESVSSRTRGVSDGVEEVIYAYIDRSSQTVRNEMPAECVACTICRDIQTMLSPSVPIGQYG